MHLCKFKKNFFLKPGHLRNPIVQDAHRMGILEQWKLVKKWCDNHAYSGLMQRIISELSNLSNKLKDTKANQNTRSKNPTTSLQLAIHFSFSSLSFLPNLETSFYIVNWYRNFGRLSFPLLVLSVSRFLGGGEIDLGPNNHEFKNQLVGLFSMVPIHSGCPWASCNLYTSYAFKTPMVFLQILSFSL